MCTAGPQPGTFRAQCAPLDLNLGPSSSVRTAGPQRPDRMTEDMPDRMPEDMPDRMPEDMPDKMPEDLPVTKCINVMVGITRSKVFFVNRGFIRTSAVW